MRKMPPIDAITYRNGDVCSWVVRMGVEEGELLAAGVCAEVTIVTA